MEKLSRLTTSRPKRLLAIVGIVLLVFVAVGGNVQDRLGVAAYEPPADAPAVKLRSQLSTAAGHWIDPLFITKLTSPNAFDSAQGRRQLRRAVAAVREHPDVGAVESPLTGNRALISDDRRSAVLAVFVREPVNADEAGDVWQPIAERVSTDGMKVEHAGWGPITTAITEQARRDLVRSEAITIPILLVLLLLVFRSLTAALIPLSIGVVGMLATFAGLRLLDEFTPVSIFALNVATALGLGLSIDYGLLLVSRYREELERAGPTRQAIATTLATAGRTAVFSSVIVATALGSLIIFPEQLIRSLGFGGVVVSVASVTAALLVAPALLALLGRRVNSLKIGSIPSTSEQEGRLHRFSHGIMRRPLIVVLVTGSFLLIAGVPALTADYVAAGPKDLPSSATEQQVSQSLREDFALGTESPVHVAVTNLRGPVSRPTLAGARSQIRQLDDVEYLSETAMVGNQTATFDVAYSGERYMPSTQQLVRSIRSADAPGHEIETAGATANFVDYKDDVVDRLPIAGVILALSMLVIVFFMTGSVVLPFKMLAMSAVTLTATFGVLVAIFQWGWLEPWIGSSSSRGLDTSLAVFILAAAYGLSTDYGIFLLARVREFHEQGYSNEEAIARGLQQTGRVITGAALLLCVALGAMAISSLSFLQQAGVGAAFAIAIDATLVRLLLVPCLMRLLGDWNWWAPAPLRRLHSRLSDAPAPGVSQAAQSRPA